MTKVKSELYGSRKTFLGELKNSSKNLWILNPFNSKKYSKELFYFLESNDEKEIINIEKDFKKVIVIFKENDTWLVNRKKIMTNKELKNYILTLTETDFKSDSQQGSKFSSNFSSFFREEMGQGFNLTNIDFYLYDKKIVIEEKSFFKDGEEKGGLYYGQFKILNSLLETNKDIKIYLVCSNNGKNFKYTNINEQKPTFFEDEKTKYMIFKLKNLNEKIGKDLNFDKQLLKSLIQDNYVNI